MPNPTLSGLAPSAATELGVTPSCVIERTVSWLAWIAVSVGFGLHMRPMEAS